MLEVRSAQPRRLALSFCRRHQLVEAAPPAPPDKNFLRALRAFDRGLELYWHPVRGTWILYRLARRGGVPGDDHMVKELELAGPQGQYRHPGPWVIDELRRLDRTRNGSFDLQTSARLYQQRIAEDLAAQDEQIARTADAVGEDFAHELIKYGYGRASVHVNRA